MTVSCHRSGSVFQQRVWPASKVSSSTRSERAFRSACESRIGTESSRVPWRIRVGVARSAVRAVQLKERSGMLPGEPTAQASGPTVSHGIARCPAAAGSPLRTQLVLMTSVQLRTGESSTSAAISPSCRGWSASWRAMAAPLTSQRARLAALRVERRIRWLRQRRSSRCGRGLFGRCRLVALLWCCGG